MAGRRAVASAPLPRRRLDSAERPATVLHKVGADQVVRPEHDMGLRLARQLTTPELVDAFDLGDDSTVIEFEANDKLTGPLATLRLPNRFDVQVIAVNRRGDVTVGPGANFEIRSGDNVVLIGSNEAIDRLREHVGG